MGNNSTLWSKWPLHFRLTQWLTKQLSYIFFYITHYLLRCHTEFWFLAMTDHRPHTSINFQFRTNCYVCTNLYLVCAITIQYKKNYNVHNDAHKHIQILLAIYCEIRKLWLQTKLKNSDSLKPTLCKSKQMCTLESRTIIKLHVLNGPCHSMREEKVSRSRKFFKM
jgi:hypothetical protein